MVLVKRIEMYFRDEEEFGIVEKGLGHLFITASSSHFFNKADFKQYLLTITKNACIKINQSSVYMHSVRVRRECQKPTVK